MNILYKDHITGQEVCKKVLAAIGNYDELPTMIKKKNKVVWPCLKVFWFNKDNSTGHNEWKKKKEVDRKRGGKTVLKSGQGCFLPAQLLCMQATPAIIFYGI